MLFEGLKEKGAIVIVPSSAVDTMNLGGMMGMVAMTDVAEKNVGQSIDEEIGDE